MYLYDPAVKTRFAIINHCLDIKNRLINNYRKLGQDSYIYLEPIEFLLPGMTNKELLVSEFSKRMKMTKGKSAKNNSLGELAKVIQNNTSVDSKTFKKEFHKRVKTISETPLKDIDLNDLTIVVRTLEAMERTHFAKIRTWLAAATVLLGGLGLGLLGFRVLLN